MSSNPREASVIALYNIEEKGEYLTHALVDALKELENVDKGFANELIMGVEKNKLYLDFLIRKFSKIRLKKLSPWVLQILRTGIYQLTMMDKIPHSAACNESVKLANKYAHSAAKNYVNGVMRSVSRSINALPEPDGSPAEILSVRYSCPLWLVEKLLNQFGKDVCIEILKDSLIPHPTTLRVNSMKTSSDELVKILKNEGISVTEDNDIGHCLRVDGAININSSEAYKNGLYTLQNINSMRAVFALNPVNGETVVDVCSAPGGKTTYIAELMNDTGKIYAFDVHPHKIELIKNAAKRIGINCIEASVHNSEDVKTELIGQADRVLADVPCSGIGVIHKKPDIKWNRIESDIVQLCETQYRILKSASAYVKNGGTLVYSTCTILEEENECQIERFLKENPEFVKDFEKLYLAHNTGGSGFYICRLVRKQV